MTYRVRISVGGLEMEIEGDREFVEERLSDLAWLDKVLEKARLHESIKQGELIGEKLSFTEYVDELEPETHPQRFLTIAYYLHRHEGRDMTYDDVKDFYQRVRWPTPKNLSDVMSDLIKDSYMEEAGKLNGKKAFRILRKGIKYVENKFRGEER
ncbi:MAG: hypothetical protein B6U65_01035 [Candidatus Wolframiiraptor sp. EX4484-121]|nr:MAG: hypothetical protein B6U65_01035 [Candidatus Wolframiiraptor sp. EX4484-121]